MNINDPIWKPFDNPTSQLLGIKYTEYIESNGHEDHRIVCFGQWTMDFKESKMMLTKDKENAEMHRRVIRGSNT